MRGMVDPCRTRWWPGARRRSRRPTMLRWWTMYPLRPLGIPWATVIVPIPVRVDAELNNRYAETRGVRVERNVSALIVVDKVGRIEPAAGVAETDVAPTPVI